MPNNYEQGGAPPELHETLIRQYGDFIVDGNNVRALTPNDPALRNQQSVVMASHPTWSETVASLATRELGSAVVLTPELITLADMPQNDTNPMLTVRQRIGEAIEVSRAQRDATFIIGTPYMLPYAPKPYNAALILRDGRIAAVERKRILMGDEARQGEPAPDAQPISLGDASVLICRDLIGAKEVQTNWREQSAAPYVERLTGDATLAARYRHTKFIAAGAKRLLVSSCWAVGLPEGLLSSEDDDPDWYYHQALRSMAGAILNTNKTLQQIIVCDRAPSPEGAPISLVLSKP